MFSDSVQVQQLISRLGLLALVPFLAGVAAPWLFGPVGFQTLPVFKLWSFTLLVFFLALPIGALAQAGSRRLPAQLLLALMLLGLGVVAMLLNHSTGGLFAGLGLLTFCHWAHWVWLQRTPAWKEAGQEFRKATGRLFWVMLASHMLALLNIVYLLRQATNP